MKRRPPLRVLRLTYARFLAEGLPSFGERLRHHLGVHVQGVLSHGECRKLCRKVRGARADWTQDFGGEQYTLGRAFYTHLETGQSQVYFDDAARSDARVEEHLPGVQARMRGLLGELLAATVRPRYGFCNAGVHVFPRAAPVAKRGGVVHYDVEGLAPSHLAYEQATATLVLMLQPATYGGGLRVFEARYRGREHPSARDLATSHRTVRYQPGDAFLMESTRLHQIRPFRGPRDRISLTLHAVEVDAAATPPVWESWF